MITWLSLLLGVVLVFALSWHNKTAKPSVRLDQLGPPPSRRPASLKTEMNSKSRQDETRSESS